jgi:hypothetical protein
MGRGVGIQVSGGYDADDEFFVIVSLVAADGSRTEVTLPVDAAERLVSDLQAHIVRGRSESQG